jgi:hypothetical protein
MQLATRFATGSPVLSSSVPLADDQIRTVAPSIFAETPHESRSERYGYVPTAAILQGLRKEGFEPFMVCQTRVRQEGRRDYTKHMLRLRHSGRIADAEADEVILINSHDGTSSYQMLAGMMRFVCKNGLVCGDVIEDVRVPHTARAADQVIEGAHRVLDGFDLVRERRDEMQAIELSEAEASLMAESALSLKYDTETRSAPVTALQVLAPRRTEDDRRDLWTTFNRLQENLLRGGLAGRTTNGRRTRTRAVTGVDQSVKLNRALWMLAEGMKQLKG